MTIAELKTAISTKTLEFEAAMEAGKPHHELLAIYKEIKQLQYELTLVGLELEYR